jgi:hypothetical protein
MKILFCTFLSIFAFSSVANATADTENFDSEVTAAFSSSNSTVPQIIPEDYLSRARAALAARLSRIKSDVTEVAEEEKFEKRKHSEITQPVRPLPSLDVFDRIDTGAWTMPHNPCPPTPRAGHYELRDLDGHAVYWKKKYDLNGKLIGFA